MLGGNAEKVFMTGKKWPSEVEGFKRNSYGMRDFNSSSKTKPYTQYIFLA